jgi:hypothetical protein
MVGKTCRKKLQVLLFSLLFFASQDQKPTIDDLTCLLECNSKHRRSTWFRPFTVYKDSSSCFAPSLPSFVSLRSLQNLLAIYLMSKSSRLGTYSKLTVHGGTDTHRCVYQDDVEIEMFRFHVLLWFGRDLEALLMNLPVSMNPNFTTFRAWSSWFSNSHKGVVKRQIELLNA